MKQFLPHLSVALFALWAIGLPLVAIYLFTAMRLLGQLKLLDHPLWLSLGSPAWSFRNQPANFREAWDGMKAQMRYCSWMLWKTKHALPELKRLQTVVRRLFAYSAVVIVAQFTLALLTFAIQIFG